MDKRHTDHYKTPSSPLSHSDFQRATEDVVPLDHSNEIPRSTQLIETPATQHARRENAQQYVCPDDNILTDGEVTMLAANAWLEYKLDGIQQGVYRKLRLGKYPLEAVLDLHRMTVQRAREQVWHFLNDARRNHCRTVLITHGRGEHSHPPAQLKSYTAHWLRQHPAVLAYHSAQGRHGGNGAVYVLLRKSESQRQHTRERIGRKQK